MQQTFVRTIQSYQTEFNRLLYPVRYKVIVRRENENPVTCLINRDEDDWGMAIENDCPDWLAKMQEDIVNVVKENEIITG